MYVRGAARYLLSMVPDPQAPDARPAKESASGTGAGRWVLLGIGGFGLGVVGSFGLLAWRGHRAAAPSREAAQLIAQAEADMQARRWEAALDKTRRVLATQGVQEPLLAQARSRSSRAEAEVQNRSIYARFTQRAGMANYDAALEAYRELPADSAYHPQAAADYDRLFPLFVEAHLQLAKEARKRGACDEARAQAQTVLAVEPKQAQALLLRDLPCTPSDSDAADEVLSEAQTHFVNGEYAQALVKARSATKSSPVRAWRIIGGTACHTRDSKLASEAYRSLDEPGRQYLLYVCGREETRVDKTAAPPAGPPRDASGEPVRRRPAK